MAGFEIKKAPVELVLQDGVISDYLPMDSEDNHLFPTAIQIENPDAELYFTPEAFRELNPQIKWGQRVRQNMYEQGGVMVGIVYRDPELGKVCGVVQHIIPSRNGGNETYLMLTHETWTQMYRTFDERFGRKDDDTSELRIIGWYHTHPNMPVRMSEIDKTTHKHFFPAEWQFSVIFNPQRKTWAAYNGKDCLSCNGVLVIHENDLPADNSESIDTDSAEQDVTSAAGEVSSEASLNTSGFSIKKLPTPKLVNLPFEQRVNASNSQKTNAKQGDWERLWGGDLFHYPINSDNSDKSFLINESIIQNIRRGILDWKFGSKAIVSLVYYFDCRATAISRGGTSYHLLNEKNEAPLHFICEAEGDEMLVFGGKSSPATRRSEGYTTLAVVFTERTLSETQLLQRYFAHDCILVFNPAKTDAFSFYVFPWHKRENQGASAVSFKPAGKIKPYFQDSGTQGRNNPQQRHPTGAREGAVKSYVTDNRSDYRISDTYNHELEKRIIKHNFSDRSNFKVVVSYASTNKVSLGGTSIHPLLRCIQELRFSCGNGNEELLFYYKSPYMGDASYRQKFAYVISNYNADAKVLREQLRDHISALCFNLSGCGGHVLHKLT